MHKVYLPNLAVLRMQGADALSFLQKMSTQDMNLLQDNNPLSTVLVDHQGKIIDILYVFKHDGELIIFCQNPHSQANIDWLEKYHFTENFVIKENNTHQAMITVSSQIIDNSYILFQSESLFACLHIKYEHNLSFMTDDEWQTLRIANKYPWFPNEINHNYMPQNIGLSSLISLNKGCFIGQEVLAKALIYQKNPLFLTSFSASEQELVNSNNQINNENFIGTITSKAPIFKDKVINCLAIVKKQVKIL